MIVPGRTAHQQIHSFETRALRRRLGASAQGCNTTATQIRCELRYCCAAIQAKTQAASSSLSDGRASGMGAPQGGVGESF